MKIYLEKMKHPRQMLKSWYMLFFLLPRLPELALSASNFRAIRRMFRSGPANKEAFIIRILMTISMPFHSRVRSPQPSIITVQT